MADPHELPEGVTVISIHPLYSAARIALATLIGGPLAGSWLMALNYKRSAERRNARLTLALGAIGTAALIALWLTLGNPQLWLWIVPLIVTPLSAFLLQSGGYDEHVAAGGRVGTSRRAAAVGAVSLVIYVVAIIAGFTGRALARLPDKMMVGEHEIYYARGASRSEAERMVQAILALDPRNSPVRRVEVTRSGDRPVLALVLDRTTWSDPRAQRQYHQLAEPLSRAVYGGAPMDVWLVDSLFHSHVKLTWESRPR